VIGEAKVLRSTVGIDKELVHGVQPPSVALGNEFGLVGAHVSGRARTCTPTFVPAVERSRCRPPCIEPCSRVDEIGVIIPAEVLAPET
jgi:hypothetical protein